MSQWPAAHAADASLLLGQCSLGTRRRARGGHPALAPHRLGSPCAPGAVVTFPGDRAPAQISSRPGDVRGLSGPCVCCFRFTFPGRESLAGFNLAHAARHASLRRQVMGDFGQFITNCQRALIRPQSGPWRALHRPCPPRGHTGHAVRLGDIWDILSNLGTYEIYCPPQGHTGHMFPMHFPCAVVSGNLSAAKADVTETLGHRFTAVCPCNHTRGTAQKHGHEQSRIISPVALFSFKQTQPGRRLCDHPP